MEIREYKKSDLIQVENCMERFEDYLVGIDDLKRLRKEKGFGKRYTKLVFKKIKQGNGKIFVAVEKGSLVGFAAGIIEEQMAEDLLENGKTKYGRLIEIFVEESHRGKKIGKKLLETVEAYLKDKGCEWVQIEVLASNKLAHSFYQFKGYINRSVDLIKKI